MLEMALERATELDGYFEKNQKTVGPLHGLPMTLIGQWHREGLDRSTVCKSCITVVQRSMSDALERSYSNQLVKKLKGLGAVPIAKVETSHMIMSALMR